MSTTPLTDYEEDLAQRLAALPVAEWRRVSAIEAGEAGSSPPSGARERPDEGEEAVADERRTPR